MTGMTQDSASPTVAVIDIGSNSIKVLVAHRTAGGRIHSLDSHALEVRISAGISGSPPRLGEEGMQSGVEAVAALVERSRTFHPGTIQVVATSAVRDAVNGSDFCARIKAATGIGVRVLAGEEEASLIGRGLLTDPTVKDFNDFYLFDLGGGSLECLRFHARRVIQAVSLPLGCVRLTESCVSDRTQPFTAEARAAVTTQVKTVLKSSAFTFSLGRGADALFIGGTMTTTRFMLAAAAGISSSRAPTRLPVSDIRSLLDRVAAMRLEDRARLRELPAARADVLPTALATVLAVAELGHITEFHTSFHNLRWGIADEALPPLQATQR